jgi:hypothetical protein
MNLERSYASQTESDTPKPEAQNFLNRLMGVWFSPGETFAEIGRAPRVLLPIILTMAMAAIGYYFTTQRIGYENLVRKQFEPMVSAGILTQERADELIAQSTTGSAVTRGKIQGVVFAALGMLVFILAVAGLLKLFTLLMGAETTFKRLLAVAAYTFVAIRLIQTLLTLIIIYLKDPDDIDIYNPIGSNLGAVLGWVGPELPKFVTALASWIDVFGIWQVALLSIGTAAVTPKMKTSTAAIFVSILYGICALIFSSMASFFR